MSSICSVSSSVTSVCDNNDGKRYHVVVKIPISLGWIEDVNFIVDGVNSFRMKHLKNENMQVIFDTYVDLDTKAIYKYYFSFLVNNERKFIDKNNNITCCISYGSMSKMSVNFSVPEWARGKIMYHIFVDRFNRGNNSSLKEMPRRSIHNSFDEPMVIGPDKDGIWNNDFYGGDLIGIIDKLDYIKSLGVSILYLSPIVYSQSNHRYDTADYENVDPYAGCNEDLVRLCNEAHKKGMKVILDAVFNHTGNDSKYFNEFNSFDTVGAYQSESSPYSKFYKKWYSNGKSGFEYWWGMPNLPVCDGYSPLWINYITGENGIIDKWFNMGIDGLRLDVADELNDSFIEHIRTAVKRNKSDGFILGEVWKNPMRMNRGYIESGKGMDSVMNYSLIDALIRYFKYADSYKLSYILNDIKNEYPEDTINSLMNFTSTHDITRAINIFSCNEFNEYSEWAWDLKNRELDWCKKYKLTVDDYKRGKELYEAYVFALTFLPGNLSIFYGDEIGMQGLGDLMNRCPFTWDKMDNDLLNYFRYIGSIRNSESFLTDASFNILDINNRYFMFERVLNDEDRALIAVNRTFEDTPFNIPCQYEKNSKVYSLKKSRVGNLTPFGGIAIRK